VGGSHGAALDTLTDLAQRAKSGTPDWFMPTNVGLWGAFDLAARDSTVTVRLSALEDVTSTADHLAVKAIHAYERMLGAALPRIESYERIRTEEQWKTQQT
jgi:hypothetical protein